MSFFSDLSRLLRTLRSGGPPGDIALLKAEMSGMQTPDEISKRKAIANNREVGHAIGREAHNSLTYRYEAHLELPVPQVRAQLNISPELLARVA